MLWIYLLDHCDNVGLVEIDLDLVSQDCGITISQEHLLGLGDRLQQVDERKWFMPKFIRFQYGSLSAQCPAHKRVLESMARHGIVEDGESYYYPIHRVLIPKKTGQDKKGKDKTELFLGEAPSQTDDIDPLWLSFPPISRNRSSKANLRAELAKAKGHPPIAQLAESVRRWCNTPDWKKDGGQFVPGAHIWVKERKWESEPEIAAPQATGSNFHSSQIRIS